MYISDKFMGLLDCPMTFGWWPIYGTLSSQTLHDGFQLRWFPSDKFESRELISENPVVLQKLEILSISERFRAVSCFFIQVFCFLRQT